MAFSLNCGFSVFGSNENIFGSKTRRGLRLCTSMNSLQFKDSHSKDFLGKPILVADHKGLIRDWIAKPSPKFSIHAQSSFCVSRALRWWDKTLKPNMIEIESAQQLVDSLLSAGDKLVIVDFYSPGCGGCKALHPKICQLAELNPNAIILKVNYEELKKMCHCLHIHVLPFFRLYRGSEGRLCSFSCTNATIKKFKDALAKHGRDRCNLGPAKGLDESELLSLASIGEISMKLPLSSTKEDRMEDLALRNKDECGALGKSGNGKMGIQEEKGAVLLA